MRITKKCLSRGSNDAFDFHKPNFGIDKQYMHHDDNARQIIRRERLHYHLNELGVDADSLEDAALRSVTTTGKLKIHKAFLIGLRRE